MNLETLENKFKLKSPGLWFHVLFWYDTNIIPWTLGREESMVRTGFSCLRIGSSGGLMWTQ